MAWIVLVVAGVLEIVWAAAMKQSDGFTKPLPTAVMLVTMLASVALLAWSMRTLPLGTAYMIWTGIGALGAFLVGVLAFAEPLTLPRLAAAALILAGIVLMKLSSGH